MTPQCLPTGGPHPSTRVSTKETAARCLPTQLQACEQYCRDQRCEMRGCSMDLRGANDWLDCQRNWQGAGLVDRRGVMAAHHEFMQTPFGGLRTGTLAHSVARLLDNSIHERVELGQRLSAYNPLNINKIWRRGWDSNPVSPCRICNLQILRCQGCQECLRCRGTLLVFTR